MTSSPSVPFYGLKFPSEEEIKFKMCQVLGPAKAEKLWEEACLSAGVDASRELDIEEMLPVGNYLSIHGGAVRTYGIVLMLRATTYQKLLASLDTETVSSAETIA